MPGAPGGRNHFEEAQKVIFQQPSLLKINIIQFDSNKVSLGCMYDMFMFHFIFSICPQVRQVISSGM